MLCPLVVKFFLPLRQSSDIHVCFVCTYIQTNVYICFVCFVLRKKGNEMTVLYTMATSYQSLWQRRTSRYGTTVHVSFLAVFHMLWSLPKQPTRIRSVVVCVRDHWYITMKERISEREAIEKGDYRLPTRKDFVQVVSNSNHLTLLRGSSPAQS